MCKIRKRKLRTNQQDFRLIRAFMKMYIVVLRAFLVFSQENPEYSIKIWLVLDVKRHKYNRYG